MVVARARRSFEPFDPIQQDNFAGEVFAVSEQMLPRDRAVEIDPEQHRDTRHAERERVFDESHGKLAPAG
jgi:hypothetical protein